MIYYETATHARENGELDTYRESYQEIIQTRNAIDKAISANFDGFRLAPAVLDSLRDHDPECIAVVLSATLLDKCYDGRFSASNRSWAYTVQMPALEPFRISSATHPAILNGFISLFRQSIA